MMKRRKLLIALGAGAFASPLGSFAQQQGKIPRVGFLAARSRSTLSAPDVYYDAFIQGMRDLGYIEGKNLVIEWRFTDGKYERLPELAAELVRLKVDLLVTHGTPGTLAAKRATTMIPIVMAVVGDAVASGLVPSLARPGGNVTGATFFNPELAAKRLEVLKDAFPRTKRVATLLNPDNPGNVGPTIKAMEITARSLKLELQRFEARGPGEFESVFAAMAKNRVDAVAINEDPMIIANVKAIADIAAKQRLRSIGFKEFAEAGGLLGYGVTLHEMFRRAGYFVDKILKGAKPGDIPIEQASRFELVINRKTAIAIGVTFPQSLLERVDKVIE